MSGCDNEKCIFEERHKERFDEMKEDIKKVQEKQGAQDVENATVGGDVKRIDENVTSIFGIVKDMNKKIDALEKRPLDFWQKISLYVVCTIIGGVLTIAGVVLFGGTLG